jgi:hypothetical protein
MKIGIKLFLAFVGFVLLCAWTIKQTSDIKKAGLVVDYIGIATDLKKAEWLIGTWVNKTQRESIYENWSKTNDNEFSGKSYIIKEQDTIVFETIKLVQEQSGLFYVPTVKNQNEGLPVSFATKSISETEIIFENTQHDFPQIISYTKITSDSLVAEISGTKNGQERKQSFSMKRMK